MNNSFFMKRALQIAQFAEGRTSPNPMVGAVIVKDGEVIAEGWHEQAGLPHAEIMALNKIGDKSQGATMYVTLEPCSHQGRTGPCADAIVKAGIAKVFVAMRDPNPLVAGQGIAKLINAGIEVEEGLLEDQAKKLNEVFLQWISHKRPFVVSKYAMSLDGKIATKTGDSKWISCDKSRQYVHQLRDRYDAIMVGIGTVQADNPSLTCRIESGQNPVRIIIDSTAQTPIDANIVCDNLAKTIIVVTDRAPQEKVEQLRSKAGVEVVYMPQVDGRVDLCALLDYLAQNEITSVFVEGGGTLHSSFLENNLVDKLHVFIAPKIISGQGAPSPVGGLGIDKVSKAWQLEDMTMETIGTDILLSGYLNKEKK